MSNNPIKVYSSTAAQGHTQFILDERKWTHLQQHIEIECDHIRARQLYNVLIFKQLVNRKPEVVVSKFGVCSYLDNKLSVKIDHREEILIQSRTMINPFKIVVLDDSNSSVMFIGYFIRYKSRDTYQRRANIANVDYNNNDILASDNSNYSNQYSSPRYEYSSYSQQPTVRHQRELRPLPSRVNSSQYSYANYIPDRSYEGESRNSRFMEEFSSRNNYRSNIQVPVRANVNRIDTSRSDPISESYIRYYATPTSAQLRPSYIDNISHDIDLIDSSRIIDSSSEQNNINRRRIQEELDRQTALQLQREELETSSSSLETLSSSSSLSSQTSPTTPVSPTPPTRLAQSDSFVDISNEINSLLRRLNELREIAYTLSQTGTTQDSSSNQAITNENSPSSTSGTQSQEVARPIITSTISQESSRNTNTTSQPETLTTNSLNINLAQASQTTTISPNIITTSSTSTFNTNSSSTSNPISVVRDITAAVSQSSARANNISDSRSYLNPIDDLASLPAYNYEALLNLDTRILRSGLTTRELNNLVTYKHKCKTSEDEDNRCVICYEDFENDQDVTALSCAHTYHENCVKTWLKTSRSCPLCKKDAVRG